MGIPGRDKATKNIMRWIARDDWADALSDVMADHFASTYLDFELDDENLFDAIGKPGFEMAMNCVFDDLLTRDRDLDGTNVVDEYLRRRGWKESAGGRRYLAAIRDSVMSVYEVTETSPHNNLHLKDLVRGGEAQRVEDRSASESAARWDCVAARILHINGKNYLASGILHLPREVADDVLGIIKKALKRGRKELKRFRKQAAIQEMVDDNDVQEILLRPLPAMVTRMWLGAVIESARRPLPRIVNFDGEEVVFCEVRFPVAAKDRDEIAGRLDQARELVRLDGDEPCWDWLAKEAASKQKSRPPKSERTVSFGTFTDEGRRHLGSLKLDGEALVLTANSHERAERGKTLFDGILDGLVGPSMTSLRSVESMIDDPPREGHSDPGSEIPPEVAEEIIYEHLDHHYHATLDDKIPMLGNKTPRQCVKTKAGRAKLVAWLKLAENNEIRRARSQGQASYDLTWMWQELGVSDLRV